DFEDISVRFIGDQHHWQFGTRGKRERLRTKRYGQTRTEGNLVVVANFLPIRIAWKPKSGFAAHRQRDDRVFVGNRNTMCTRANRPVSGGNIEISLLITARPM